MSVVLESCVRRMQVFNLPHEAYCRAQCGCSQLALTVLAENPRTGERAPKHVTKRVPGSLTLLARERRVGLPNAVLDVPEIQAAIRLRHVRVLEQTADAPPVPRLAEIAVAAHSPATTKPPVPPTPTGAPSPTLASTNATQEG